MFDRLQQRFLQYMMRRFVGNYNHTIPPGSTTVQGGDPEDAERRARNLLNEMSLSEKIDYISGIDSFATKEIPRLNIPRIYAADATSGVRCFGDSTNFPAGVAMAATWNRELIERVGDVVGKECRAKGASILLGPGVNIARVPTCGRNFEYMGEDPYLAGEMAASYINGVQRNGVITTIKHFACNNSDYDRHKTDSVVDERTLHEIYLPAFKKAVREAKSIGVMSSYNPINGVYASENAYLLQEVLREEWGFDGFVMSDWNSLYSTEGPIRNGLDIEMPGAKWLNEKNIQEAIDKKSISMKQIDGMVFNLLKSFIQAGIFDRPTVDANAPLKSKEHRSIALQTSDEAVVLLKNKRALLPLDRQKVHRIAVVGNNGLVTATGGGGSSYLIPEEGMHSIYDALRLSNSHGEVQYITSSRGLVDERDINFIVKADAVVIATGFNYISESEAYDRSWELPDHQQRLIEQMTAVNRNCIVILHGGGAMGCTPWIDVSSAVIHAMYLGQEAGNTIARILYGETNPSGRLPFTMAEHFDDYESVKNYVKDPAKMEMKRVKGGQGNPDKRKITKIEYKEGLKVGYRDTMKPLFPFGHGLSYTKFSLFKLQIQKDEEKLFPITVSSTVKNTGKVRGKEVIQLYIHDKEASVYRPEKELKNFFKIDLDPGRQKKISMVLHEEDFSFYDTQTHSWILEPGVFTILIGVSSSDIRLRSDIDIT